MTTLAGFLHSNTFNIKPILSKNFIRTGLKLMTPIYLGNCQRLIYQVVITKSITMKRLLIILLLLPLISTGQNGIDDLLEKGGMFAHILLISIL